VEPHPRVPIAKWDAVRDVWETIPPDHMLPIFALLDVFSETWPTSGSMRNGSVYPPPPSEPPTDDSGSLSSPGPVSLLPTPDSYQADRGGVTVSSETPRRRSQCEPGRRSGTRLLPTPNASTNSDGITAERAAERAAERERGNHVEAGNGALTEVLGFHLLPTPAVNDMGAGKTVEEWDAWTERMKSEHGNGNGHGKSLSIEAQRLPVTTWGIYEPAVRRWEALTRPAPEPLMKGAKGGTVLAPVFSEWMMGLDEGHVTDVPGLSREDKLRALGNGVIPWHATHAVRTLIRRLL